MTDRFAATRSAAAATGFSGVLRVRVDDHVEFEAAYGEADRARGLPNTVDTRFGIASGTKTLTALTVMRLVEQGALTLATPVRDHLGRDLPMVDDAVTVEHLLRHTSGIGDYLDEDVIEDFEVWPGGRPPSAFTTTAAYLPELDGREQKFPPGTQFAYCNSGFVLLALVSERATGTAWPELMRRAVTGPAHMTATEYLRTDATTDAVAVGYLTDGRTNVGVLPSMGSGDGGVVSTLGDIERMWAAVGAGTIIDSASLAVMTRPGPLPTHHPMQYGLGVWLDTGRGAIVLEGCDAGISVRSIYDPVPRRATTVISNTMNGAWAVVDVLAGATDPR